MTTRRERLEAKVEKRAEWSEKAAARSEARFNQAHAIGSLIPMGQPILVGHHSQRRHERAIEKIDANMHKGVEEAKLASHHASKGANLEHMLERTIFDDDPDAIERLEARILEREASAELNKAINKAYRKGGWEAVKALPGVTSEALARMVRIMELCPWSKQPCSSTGDRAGIRADRERIERIKARRARAEKAAEAPGGVLVEEFPGCSWVRVTFPEKPVREVLQALREAGFRWGGGCWSGEKAKLEGTVLRHLMPGGQMEVQS